MRLLLLGRSVLSLDNKYHSLTYLDTFRHGGEAARGILGQVAVAGERPEGAPLLQQLRHLLPREGRPRQSGRHPIRGQHHLDTIYLIS
jgi:hypothetical protein